VEYYLMYVFKALVRVQYIQVHVSGVRCQYELTTGTPTPLATPFNIWAVEICLGRHGKKSFT
jgi:hypothetical protein